MWGFFACAAAGSGGCGGLNHGEDLFAVPLLVEDVFEGFLAGGVGEVGDGGEVAVGWVDDDFFYQLPGGRGFGLLLAGEVEGGDLEAVEEESGAARVNVVGRDAAEDFAD
jgi:hypothetical protein